MVKNLISRGSVAALLLGCALVASPVMLSRQAAAQNPVVSNAIPEGGAGAVHGKVVAIQGRTLVVEPYREGGTIALQAPANINLANVDVGDHISAHYSRTVVFVVGTPLAAPPRGATETMDRFAKSTGISSRGGQLTGRVTKIDGPHAFDVVDNTGGGVYTVQVSDPSRQAVVQALKVGDSVTIIVSPLMLTSIEECGLLGCL